MTFDEWYNTAPLVKNARDAFYAAYVAGYEQAVQDVKDDTDMLTIDYSDDGGEDYGDLR